MSYHVRRIRRESPKSKPRSIKTLQKPNGVISHRVQKVGGEHFAIVCVDPAKHRSAWMMADYFCNVLIAPQVLQRPFDLCLADGQRVSVKHPEFVAMNQRIVIVTDEQSATKIL